MARYKMAIDDLFGGTPTPFNPTPRAHKGVDTSEAAAKSLSPSSAVQKRILTFIIQRGPHGAHYDEIVAALNMEKPTVAGRLNDLHTAKLIVDSKLRRKTSSGRSARVYVATHEGRRACQS